MLNDLLLMSGIEVPFAEAGVNIHQPTLREIAYVGEENFFIGCEFLNFSKDILSDEDKSHLENTDNFEVFMSIMVDRKTVGLQRGRLCAIIVLGILFPNYNIKFSLDKIILEEKDEETGKSVEHYINKNNFEKFKKIIVDIFCLNRGSEEATNYNPKGKQAKAIAEKLKKGRQKAAEIKGNGQKISLYSRFISIVSVGMFRSINDLLDYTLYQLFDTYDRYELKVSFDFYMKAKLAGASGMDEPEHWMKEIH